MTYEDAINQINAQIDEHKVSSPNLNTKCGSCMYDAPHSFCCKRECNEHEFCRGCTAKSGSEKIPDECKWIY